MRIVIRIPVLIEDSLKERKSQSFNRTLDMKSLVKVKPKAPKKLNRDVKQF
jgi:hypothetical protein